MRIRYILFSLLILFPVLCNACEKESDANDFWQKFRHAVIANRIEDVTSLTRFPFEVRGPVDSDPVVLYDRSHFPSIFRRLSSQRVEVTWRGKLIEMSMSDVIKKKETLEPKDYLTLESIRVHQFVFNRIKGKWFFKRAYLEE